ncbi:MAG: hypothetical protein LC640_05625 [Frankia sp.]|nr:hypothetical protein [Frankia sp.]
MALRRVVALLGAAIVVMLAIGTVTAVTRLSDEPTTPAASAPVGATASESSAAVPMPEVSATTSAPGAEATSAPDTGADPEMPASGLGAALGIAATVALVVGLWLRRRATRL